ncbi:hypothetical protein HAX54_049845 [Datura stramonium]|uniref:CCHC-type domain-containing protein n=1 Tax=Datura stramonium TaxID=4076 RepID=A0ABS8SX70_DATST|nr:hypothetical protein [Datura stramonium]
MLVDPFLCVGLDLYIGGVRDGEKGPVLAARIIVRGQDRGKGREATHDDESVDAAELDPTQAQLGFVSTLMLQDAMVWMLGLLESVDQVAFGHTNSGIALCPVIALALSVDEQKRYHRVVNLGAVHTYGLEQDSQGSSYSPSSCGGYLGYLDSSRQIHLKGGCCECGDLIHFKKDCPRLR